MKTQHYADADALSIRLSPDTIAGSEDVSPGIVVDFDESGHRIGVEVLNARCRLPDGADLPEEAV